MRVTHKAGRLGIFMIGLFMPFTGLCGFEGEISVFAWDSRSGENPPPATRATLNGDESRLFGTNDVVSFSGSFEAGTYVLEVSTESAGYVLRQSPTDPGSISDPYSTYGNPRYIELSESTNFVPVSFQFDPIISANATVRDARTMKRLEGASVEFIFDTSSGKQSVHKYPATASYAGNWITDTEGNFPTNTILYLREYDLTISRSNYLSFTEYNIITNASPGDAFALGTILLDPVDNNTNGVADEWEIQFFSSLLGDVNADDDGDRMSNRDEYLAGTDPTNRQSCLWVESFPETNGIGFVWPVEPDRTYRICGTTNLCATNAWIQLGGPWETTADQTEMVWVETNLDLSWNSSYRVEVVPAWWQETNEVLVNTNRPSVGGSGSQTNFTGAFPPIPGF